MSKALRIRLWSGVAVLSVALVLIVASLLTTRSHPDTASAASDLGKRVERRVDVLESYVRRALEADPDSWLRLEGLPEDMVVYRYREDTLQSWAHQFPLRNDDIRGRTVVQRLGDGRGESVSPLAQLTETFTFVNYGPKWYLARSVREGDLTVISGLELVNELKSSSFNGINPRLHLGDRYSVQPLTGSIGVPVEIYGTPLFKITSENASEPERHNSLLFWLGILLFLAGTLAVLSAHTTLGAAGIAIAVQGLFLAGLYFYGRGLGPVSQLFSPLLYADGAFRYSLGAVVILNLLFTMVVLDLYVVRRALLRLFQDGVSKVVKASVAALLLAGIAFICIHIHITFRSIVFNSGICLELFKVSLLDGYTAVVYASFLALALTIPLLLHLLSPLLRDLVGLRYNVFSRTGRLIFAVLTAAYFVFVSSLLGFHKEENRVEVWANRLAMDRDISLEIQLRAVEASIAADPVIGTLSVLENSHEMIRGRLVNSYMNRLSQDYDISAVIPTPSSAMDDLFNERIRSGVRLAENSHFFYSPGTNGRARYSGLFSYYTPDYGASSVLVLVEPKSNREDRGYLSLLGVSEPGRVVLPPAYSYAKYVSNRLVIYKGDFAYPTLVSDRLGNLVTDHPNGHLVLEDYMHFVQNISDDEMIVVSRAKTEWLNYIVEGVLFALVAYLLASLAGFRFRRQRAGERHYYRTRISVVLYVSLIITLVAMAAFSVYFVYRRNNADLQNIMTSRITALQSMLQGSLRGAVTGDDLRSQAAKAAVEDAGNDLKCDITLFTPDGRMVLSTTPEIYDRKVAGCRIAEDAYYSIVLAHRRFSIQRERLGNRRYYALYAPIINAAGEMVAIASTPYTEQSYDFEDEALVHIASILTVFLLLLMITRVVTEEVIGRMFRPLSEMGRKMKVSDVDHLEYIVYDQDDELSSLVRAYNLMVHDLSDSTRQLAQAERDKAWSAMARQVAHEIKNPLTPIKLKLQMLIRMKQSGNPAWEDKFDEVSSAVLEHIDILADTATEFSTFAKLYSEEPVRIDLDALVREEVQMFDARDDVSLTYYGLEGAVVSGPKPQLTRVLVNLITNAIQALDGRENGQVVVSLRNSGRDGFYDIVVEDNGPGVKEENRGKLFTPDFTTKSHGTGLGLAICRNIIDRCGGEISYSKSFSLGGACFTVRYPKLSK
ncbi:MAG: cache domain-containing protein [Bacteroidales bacterium]|nr:cache domain-containing protein [Bacteroidales bacterium]